MNQDQDRIDRLIQAVLTVDPPQGLENRIRQRVRSEARARRVLTRRLVFSAGLAAAIVLIVLMIDLPHRESNRVERASAPEYITEPAAASTRVHAAPPVSWPSPVSPAESSNMPATVTMAGIAVGDPLAKAASSVVPVEAISPTALKDFSLETVSPLITAALPDPGFPQFEIRAFTLLASNEGVLE